MGWWGKLIGGAFGFMLGGPLGAMLGAALGHNFDRGLSGVRIGHGDEYVGDTERIQSAFFTATFSVMGHLAKADGHVSPDEISMARQLMSHMQLNGEQQKIAIRLFNKGKESDFQLAQVLEQFRIECHRRRNLIQMFIEIQISTALADGVLHNAEQSLLISIGNYLGFSSQIIEQLIRMAQAQQYYAYEGFGATPSVKKASLDDAYMVLGISKSASDAELKKAYRRLMNQHHPDKLVAKGLPEEMMRLATEKTQEIKLAYEQIKQSRDYTHRG